MSNTVHFERFVAAHPDLKPLLHPAADFEKHRKAYIVLNSVDPAVYALGRHIYVDIRAWIGTDCPGWYPNTALPDLHRIARHVRQTARPHRLQQHQQPWVSALLLATYLLSETPITLPHLPEMETLPTRK